MTQTMGGAFIPEVELEGKTRPFWSVIVPIYQRTKYLKDCLNSILDQDPGADDMEIIVTDDATPSDLSGLVHQLGRGRVEYRRNPTNVGLYPNTNQAIQAARGRWIHILHDDDWVDKKFYQEMRKSAESALPSVGVAFCMYKTWTEQDRSYWSPPAFRHSDGKMPRDFLIQLATGNPLNLPAVIFKRSTFERVGLFRADLPFTADWEWYVRSMVSVDWHYCASALAFYRLHDQNLTNSLAKSGKTAENIRRTLDIFADVLPKDMAPLCLPGARQMHARQFLSEALAGIASRDAVVAEAFMIEALRICPDACAFPEFGRILQHRASGALRHRIAASLIFGAGHQNS
jgi:protein O-GlcNAc transferase